MGEKAWSEAQGAKWTQIRVSRDTLAALAQFRDHLVALAQAGNPAVNMDFGGSIPSLDWCIQHLLAKADGHRKRAKKQRARKRASKQGESQ